MNCTGKEPRDIIPTEMVCSSIEKIRTFLKRLNFLFKSAAISVCVLVLSFTSTMPNLPEAPVLPPPHEGTLPQVNACSGIESCIRRIAFNKSVLRSS